MMLCMYGGEEFLESGDFFWNFFVIGVFKDLRRIKVFLFLYFLIDIL